MRTYVANTIALVAVLLLMPLVGVQADSQSNDLPAAPGAYSGPNGSKTPTGWNLWGESMRDDDVHNTCGKYDLVFRNPDLQEDEDGIIHATNRFFIQFQAVGDGADEIVRFAFSFGKTHDQVNDNPTLGCTESIPDNPAGKGVGGAYILYYRSDYNPTDGFFVPIVTTNVPDGDYAAAVHAYNSAGDEVARAWAKAVVENCVGFNAPTGTCSEREHTETDIVQPWPMILPGDGQQTNSVTGLTVEFFEKIQNDSVQISLNGADLQFEEWVPPARDDDVQPLNDPDNPDHPLKDCLGVDGSAACRRTPGTGYKIDGQAVEEGDIIRVSALDNAGNMVVKTIHFGKDTSAGTVTSQCAEVQFELLSTDNVEIAPGSVFDFNMRLANIGTDDAHVNLIARYNDTRGITVGYTDVAQDHGHADKVHSQIAPGSQNKFNLTVEALEGAQEGRHEVEAILDYTCQGLPKEQAIPIVVIVKQGATGGTSTKIDLAGEEENMTTETDDAPDVEEDTPGIGIVAAFGSILLAMVAVARRRE